MSFSPFSTPPQEGPLPLVAPPHHQLPLHLPTHLSSTSLPDINNIPPELDMLEEDRQRASESNLAELQFDVYSDATVTTGWIEEIHLHNFKSYGGTHKIGPFGRFTGIVGPNGAGKSNLMDAISFVLGLHSISIRGTSLKELIYRREEEGDVTALGRSASVTLVFKDVQKDCSVEFSRKISSKGVGSFYINSSRVNQADYFKRFSEYNILVKAKNFLVFQGDVEEIAQKDPKELSKVFEQICGSDAFQESYETTLAEYKSLQYESRRAFLQKKHIENEYKSLMKQQEEAEEYEAHVEQLQTLTREFFLMKLFTNEAQGASWEEQRGSYENLRLQLESKLEEFKTKAITLEKKKLKDQLNVESKEIKLNKKKQEIDEMKPKYAKAEEELRFEERGIDELRKREKSCEYQRVSLHRYIEEREKSIKETEYSLVELQTCVETAEKQTVELTVEQQRRYEEIEVQLNKKVSDKHVKMHRTKREMRGVQSAIDYLEKELINIDGSKYRSEQSLKEAEAKCVELNDKIKSTVSPLRQKMEELSHIEEQFTNCIDRRQRLLESSAAIEKQLSVSNANRMDVKHQKQRRQLVKDMQDSISTVYGYFPELCTPNSKRYNIAVSASLGKFNETIITDTLKAAKSAIRYLKTHRCDRMEFLPLDVIERRSFNPLTRNISPNAVCMLDCIHFDESFKSAFEYALADTQCVDSLNEAKEICYSKRVTPLSVKVVTLSGERILKNGNIVVDTDNGNWVNQFDVNEHTKLEDRLNAVRKELQEIEDIELNGTARVTQLKREIERLERSNRQLEGKLGIWKNQTKMKRIETEEYNKLMSTKEDEKHQKEKQLSQISIDVENIESEINEVEDELFSEFCKSIGVPNFRKIQNEIKVAKDKKRMTEKKLLLRLQKLKADKEDAADKLSTIQDAASVEKLIAKKIEEVKGITTTVSALSCQITELEKQYFNCKLEVEELTAKKRESESNLIEFKETVQDVLDELDKYATKITEIEYKISTADKQAIQKLKQGLMEGVTFPLKSGTTKDLRALSEGKATEADVKLDYSSLPAIVQNDALEVEKMRVHEAAYEQRIAETREQLSLRHPNLKAKEKCEEAKLKLDELEEFVHSTRKECSAAERKFRAAQSQRGTLFMKCFNHVKQAIERIYYNLTVEDASYDVGGQTFVDLDDSTGVNRDDDPFLCGIRYHAMPPSARFRDIHLLSGGEKTMAALALLFALQSFHPSPFFVLDEVDASLDPKNVNALARYLSETKFQAIVISLKDKLFSCVDVLVGVLKNRETASSKHLMLNLAAYRNYEVENDKENDGVGNTSEAVGRPPALGNKSYTTNKLYADEVS